MTKKEIEKKIEETYNSLRHVNDRISQQRIVEYREPREHVYSQLYGGYDIQDAFELKEAVEAILEHLGLRLSKTKAVPAKTVLEKKNGTPPVA